MHTTLQLCRAVQNRHNITSTYGLAKKFNVSISAAQHWIAKKSVFSTDNAIKCAELLELNPYYLMACVEHERAKTATAKKYWKALAENPPDQELAYSLKNAS